MDFDRIIPSKEDIELIKVTPGQLLLVKDEGPFCIRGSCVSRKFNCYDMYFISEGRSFKDQILFVGNPSYEDIIKYLEYFDHDRYKIIKTDEYILILDRAKIRSLFAKDKNKYQEIFDLLTSELKTHILFNRENTMINVKMIITEDDDIYSEGFFKDIVDGDIIEIQDSSRHVSFIAMGVKEKVRGFYLCFINPGNSATQSRYVLAGTPTVEQIRGLSKYCYGSYSIVEYAKDFLLITEKDKILDVVHSLSGEEMLLKVASIMKSNEYQFHSLCKFYGKE